MTVRLSAHKNDHKGGGGGSGVGVRCHFGSFILVFNVISYLSILQNVCMAWIKHIVCNIIKSRTIRIHLGRPFLACLEPEHSDFFVHDLQMPRGAPLAASSGGGQVRGNKVLRHHLMRELDKGEFSRPACWSWKHPSRPHRGALASGCTRSQEMQQPRVGECLPRDALGSSQPQWPWQRGRTRTHPGADLGLGGRFGLLGKSPLP